VRPVHTNAAIFGFTLGVVFAGTYYGIQRLCRVRMFSDTLSRLNLWGWNAISVAGAASLPTGHSTGKEYAELEWPIDVALAVWLIYAGSRAAIERSACSRSRTRRARIRGCSQRGSHATEWAQRS